MRGLSVNQSEDVDEDENQEEANEASESTRAHMCSTDGLSLSTGMKIMSYSLLLICSYHFLSSTRFTLVGSFLIENGYFV